MKELYGFISTGEKTAMYTLRVMYKMYGNFRGEVVEYLKDVYWCNLSTNKEDANKKAQIYCAELDIPFRGNADFDLNEIKRRKAEEVAKDKENAERLEREEAIAWEKEFKQRMDEFEDQVSEGVFITGKYLGSTAAEVYKMDVGYIMWFGGQSENEGLKSKFDVNVSVAKKFIAENNLGELEFVGKVGEKIELEITLISAKQTNGQYPTIVWTCETPEKNIVKFFSRAKGFKALEIGDTFKIEGTVKDHSIWNELRSTLINRPKIIK